MLSFKTINFEALLLLFTRLRIVQQVYLKTCHSLDLEREDSDSQRFEYTWLNSFSTWAHFKNS